jgi:1,4-dihydroxy-2-naphthoate polyprenyltransferase
MSAAHDPLAPAAPRDPREPTRAALSNPLLRYFLATRPPFLAVTLCAYLVGVATAYASGVPLRPGIAALTLLSALAAHAAVNVLNDYYDALSGCDEANTQRVFPYTGGSRFIQNGVLSLRETGIFGAALLGTVTVAGIGLAAHAGPGLYAIGAAGLAIGWAYSAPPLQLNSRGLGEACVAAGFALIAVGTDFVQRGAFAGLPAVAAVSYALLVTNVLYMNQFPDREADAQAGKRHWVVRLGAARARWGYALIACGAYLWLACAVALEALPLVALAALPAAGFSIFAARELWRFAAQPQRLAPAIRATIAGTLAHGALLAAALAYAR